MIRLFVWIGIVGGLAITYLATFAVAPEFQLAPAKSQLVKFRAEGLVPDANALTENEEAEHGIFEVPPEDEEQLEQAMSVGGMGGMNMQQGTDQMSATTMQQGTDQMTGMASGNGDSMDAMQGEPGSMDQGGLRLTEDGMFDREISLSMDEWRFSNMNIEVKKGESIRFNITNEGKIPHEFMFMTMPAMSAINYRARRADWSLLEHEALYEKSLVLPGGSFSFVAKIEQAGVWMFMCMLPYHMQMGMMGQMATEGMAMKMQM